MAQPTVNERLEALESQVAKLQSELVIAQVNGAKDWRRAVQKYAGDGDLQNVFAAALELREADRKRARQRPSRRSSR